MLDARNVYRKVTRKIFDFSPEQQQNLTAVVWLYRGEGNRFIELVRDYVDKAIFEARYCQFSHLYNCAPVPDFIEQLGKLSEAFQPFMDKLEQDGINVEPYVDFLNAKGLAEDGWSVFQVLTNDLQKWWNQYEKNDAPSLLEFIDKDACLKDLAEQSRNLIKEIDLAYKLATRVIELAEASEAKDSDLWDNSLLNSRGHGSRKSNLKKNADEARKLAVEQLKQVRYFYKQAHWLLSRFPKGELRDVEGLVKLVDIVDIEAADWSLTPGRYVGVAPEEVDEDFDFEETLRDIHIELKGLNAEAVELAENISRNFEELGV